MSSLDGKAVFVTGGTAGIGLAVARRFAAAGAGVVIAGRRDGDALAQEIGARFVRTDVTDEKQVVAAMEFAEAALGKLDVIVNNAGSAGEDGVIADYGSDAFREIFEVNVFGVFYGLKHGPRAMRDGGSIINTSSVAATHTFPAYGPYSATKAAVEMLTRAAALELAPRGIRVNAVAPGGIETEMAPDTALIEALAPAGRMGTPRECASLFEFLASDESRYVTGQSIRVDGGLTAGFSAQLMDRLEI